MGKGDTPNRTGGDLGGRGAGLDVLKARLPSLRENRIQYLVVLQRISTSLFDNDSQVRSAALGLFGDELIAIRGVEDRYRDVLGKLEEAANVEHPDIRNGVFVLFNREANWARRASQDRYKEVLGNMSEVAKNCEQAETRAVFIDALGRELDNVRGEYNERPELYKAILDNLKNIAVLSGNEDSRGGALNKLADELAVVRGYSDGSRYNEVFWSVWHIASLDTRALGILERELIAFRAEYTRYPQSYQLALTRISDLAKVSYKGEVRRSAVEIFERELANTRDSNEPRRYSDVLDNIVNLARVEEHHDVALAAIAMFVDEYSKIKDKPRLSIILLGKIKDYQWLKDEVLEMIDDRLQGEGRADRVMDYYELRGALTAE